METKIMSKHDRSKESTITAPENTEKNAVDYAAMLCLANQDDRKAIILTIPVDMTLAVAQAVNDLLALEKAHKEAEEKALAAREGLLNLFAPAQATITDLAAHIKAKVGDNPTQGQFLSSLLQAIGYDYTKAKATAVPVIAAAVVKAITESYPNGLPESVSKGKTTWAADKTTTTRIRAHIIGPPKYYVEGNC